MKKINLLERFQQLAGIKSLHKSKTNFNAKGYVAEIGTEDLNETQQLNEYFLNCDCKDDSGWTIRTIKGCYGSSGQSAASACAQCCTDGKPADNPGGEKTAQTPTLKPKRGLREEKECSTDNNVGAQGGQNHVDCGGNGKTCNHFGECVPMANLGSSGKTTNKKNPFDTGTGPTNPNNEYEKYFNLIKQSIKELEDDDMLTTGGTILTEKQTCAEIATAGFENCDVNDDADPNFDFDGCVQGVFSAYSACKKAAGGSIGLPQDNTNYKDLTKVNPTNPTGKSIPLPKRRDEYNY